MVVSFVVVAVVVCATSGVTVGGSCRGGGGGRGGKSWFVWIWWRSGCRNLVRMSLVFSLLLTPPILILCYM